MSEDFNDFEWRFNRKGKPLKKAEIHRPSDIFLSKVMGKFPRESEDTLISFDWIKAAQERWKNIKKDKDKWAEIVLSNPYMIGCDVAGQGADTTVFQHRFGRLLAYCDVSASKDHVEISEKIYRDFSNELYDGNNKYALIDTIGEGAGVYPICKRMSGFRPVSVKFSENTQGLTDKTKQRLFMNMRAYCYWAMRDAFDPAFGYNIAIPPDPELEQELLVITYDKTLHGKIRLPEKKEIKKLLKRSPDKADAFALTFYPVRRYYQEVRVADDSYNPMALIGRY